MLAKPVIRRQTADDDIESIIDHYLGTAGAKVAIAFVDALEVALSHIGRNAGMGSRRYALQLEIPDLRSWPLNRFPHLVFYFDTGSAVEIWRVLHGAMDLPEWLDT